MGLGLKEESQINLAEAANISYHYIISFNFYLKALNNVNILRTNFDLIVSVCSILLNEI